MGSTEGDRPAASGIGKRRIAAKADGSEYYSERRAALIAAAATLFKEKGFKATSLDDVARLAGTDRASVYYYISGKKELFFEVVRDAIETTIGKAEEIHRGPGTPAEKLEALLVILMDSYGRNYPNLYVFIQEDLSNLTSSGMPQSESLAGLNQRFEAITKDVIQAGIKDGSFREDMPATIIAYAAIGMVNWTHRWYEPAGKMPAADIGRAFAKLMLSGVLKG